MVEVLDVNLAPLLRAKHSADCLAFRFGEPVTI